MRGLVLLGLLTLLPEGALAESLVTTHTLRGGSVIAETDVVLVDADIPGAATSLAAALGQELRETVYAGRPVLTGNLGPPALIERNQIVPLLYLQGALAILAEGRALTRGAVGEVVKVMNTTSHTSVFGIVEADGTVRVGRP